MHIEFKTTEFKPPQLLILGVWEKLEIMQLLRSDWFEWEWGDHTSNDWLSQLGELDLSFALLWTILLTCVDPKEAAVELGISLCATQSQAVCL